MNELTVWRFEGSEVRTTTINGEPWWVLRDVCEALGIKNSKNVSARLDDDQKGVHKTDPLYPGGSQEVTIINESGLYEVIIRSNKPEAKAFRKWITSEVLPEIRKTGKYEMERTTVPVKTITLAKAAEQTGVSQYRIVELIRECFLKENWDYYIKGSDYVLTERGYNLICQEYKIIGIPIDSQITTYYEPLPPPKATEREKLMRVRELGEFLISLTYLKLEYKDLAYGYLEKVKAELNELI